MIIWHLFSINQPGEFKNFDPGAVKRVVFAENESQVAVMIKSGLRRQGVCGLAQAAIELDIDPNTGNIVRHRILRTNSDEIAGKIPGSRFERIDAGHFMPTTSPKALLDLLLDFWGDAK